MEGFLRGKCIPGDMKVNETNAEYLMRKFSEADSEITSLKKKLSVINSLAEAAEQASKLAQEATEKLVHERNALAAENAHMQQVIGDVQTLYYESDGIVGYHLNGDIAKWDDVMPDLWAETPATDAFLAEVRDSGVDALVERRLTAAQLAKEAGHEITARDLEGEAIRARFFAMELRKGVQS
ncbi:hypothetical protein V8J08_005448 [Citrobacter amalonaticus]